MGFKCITYENIEKIAVITMNLPEMRNPLTEKLVPELVRAIREADEDQNTHAIILTGNGSVFSAGGDLSEFKKNFDKPVPQLYKEGLESTELFKLGAQVKTPIIASVNGPALGGGTGLAAMSHIAIASDKAKLGLTELRLGIVPYVIMPWVRRAVGDRKLLDLMLTARILTAQEAKEMGLVHYVVPHEQLKEETWKIAETIASFSPLAVRLSLEAYRSTEQVELMKSFDFLSTMRIVSFQSEDLKEGASAFLEKREPVWKGR
ncbi:enoyl-CoA hydratase/isomerase family protein [Bacillus sp. T33-2]|uniref:enoyl-CoA hydratase/isomerase family protein n=1 Tax=Bacillus sp. T33-2 TaxID=2054168 RepID=UPI000C77C27D|nr:enoyl-CoA hydratase/isomerase family protein [Bacillus sp. T33-2]PLR91611.1 enoyl-CoA hydratase/isomerase family protein [Bacillus sp. T33-2]